MSDAGLTERIDGRGNLIVGTDERSARSATEQSDAGPQSRRKFERPGVPAGDESLATAVDLRHPALPDRLGGLEPCLGPGHIVGVDGVVDLLCDGPGLFLGVAGDDMEADAVVERPAVDCGAGRDGLQLRSDVIGVLTPGEVDVGTLRGGLDAGRRGSAEEDRRNNRGTPRQRSPVDRDVVTVDVHRVRLRPQPVNQVERLVSGTVALLLGGVVTVGTLFGVLTTDDDVEQQPVSGELLVGLCLLGEECGRNKAGTVGDKELQTLGRAEQGRGGEPGVLAPATGGGEDRLEAVVLRSLGQLGEIAQVREPVAELGVGTVPTSDDSAGVAVGGEEPVEGHIGGCWKSHSHRVDQSVCTEPTDPFAVIGTDRAVCSFHSE